MVFVTSSNHVILPVANKLLCPKGKRYCLGYNSGYGYSIALIVNKLLTQSHWPLAFKAFDRTTL